MQDILQALATIFTPNVMLFMLIGVAVGSLIGALPGLSVTMAIALLTPMTFWLEPAQGLAMMLGVYNSGVWAGGISAILINTPGTPASIMQTMDGYTMTQRGDAGMALGINTVYSVIGGIFSTIILMIAAIPIANFALNFGPAEYAMLAVFGLSMIISISGKSILKGIIAGLIGFLISTIGQDSMLGYPRSTFGVLELFDGVPFVAMMIGLFGISEVLAQIVDTTKEQHQQSSFHGKIGRILPKGKMMLKYLPTTLMSCVIGTLVGAIPGAGGDIASIIAWDQARKVSKEHDEFGKGSPEGLAVTSLANNAVIGGAMTTMLSLGVPGDAATAVLIGTLMIYGVTPGPLMFIDHLPMVYGIMIMMIVANLFILVLGLATAKVSAKALNKLSARTLWVAILILCFLGAYAINNSIVDVWIMLIAGALGFIFRKMDIPLAPIVLALVLGPMAESNLRRMLVITQGSYAQLVTHPIALILLIISVGSLIVAFFQNRKAARKAAAKAQMPQE